MNYKIKRNKFGIFLVNIFLLYSWYCWGTALAEEWGYYEGTITQSIIVYAPMVVIAKWIWDGNLNFKKREK
tara:strand:+ start:412 stop:624 length:213 start_codon:yes stop_codon:yes gene_type:complete